MLKSVDFRDYVIGDGTYLVASPDGGTWVVDDESAWVLRHCCVPRSADEHARKIAAELGLNELGPVHQMLGDLMSKGLLREQLSRSPNDKRHRERRSPPRYEPISTIAILTRDRPEALENCLKSCLNYLFRFRSMNLRLMVIDESRNLSVSLRNRRACQEARQQWGFDIKYDGEPEKLAYLAAARRAGLPERLLSFGFLSGDRDYTPGCGRNRLLGLTAGERVYCIDDDTLLTTWAHPEIEQGLRLGGHDDPTDTWFFDDRVDAAAFAGMLDIDMVGAHASALGLTPDAILDESNPTVDFTGACDHLITAASSGNDPSRVRCTFNGICGDSGLSSSLNFILATGGTRERMAGCQAVYDTALSRRNVCRVAKRLTIVHEAQFLTTAYAFDNTGLLPPFIPDGRNEDGLFGALLRVCDNSALTAHLPYGIMHNSGRSSEYPDHPLSSAGRVRATDILMAFSRAIQIPAYVSEAGDRMRLFGKHLMWLGRSSPIQFVEFARHCLISELANSMRSVERQFQSFDYPEFWRKDLLAYRRCLLDRCHAEDIIVPSDSRRTDSDCALAQLRNMTAIFGELVACWPEIMAFFSKMRETRQELETI